MKVVDFCKMYGISDVTFYKWRTKYGGLDCLCDKLKGDNP